MTFFVIEIRGTNKQEAIRALEKALAPFDEYTQKADSPFFVIDVD